MSEGKFALSLPLTAEALNEFWGTIIKGNQPESVYDYKCQKGNTHFFVCRYELGTKKKIRPFSYGIKNNKEGWHNIWPPAPRPLYNLEEVASRSGAPILIVEGEKAVEAAKRLFPEFVVVTSPMGSNSASGADWQPIADRREITIWPDNDDAGKKYAQDVARKLVELDCAIARVVEPPKDFPESWDLADPFPNGFTVEDLRKLIDTAKVKIEAIPVPPPRSGLLSFVSLPDLLSEPVEDIAWLVHELLTIDGLSILVGKPKQGKSTLIRNLARCVAQGSSFLDRQTTKGKVLYLALEERRSELRQHFEDMNCNEKGIYIHCGQGPENPFEELEKAVSEHSPALVIIDPLLRYIKVDDLSSYTEVNDLLAPLMALAREKRTQILCVHHTSKGDRDGGDSILGSTAIFGAVDTAILLKRSENETTVRSIQRYGKNIENSRLKFNPDSRTLDVECTVSEANELVVEKQILALLESTPQAFTLDEIQDVVRAKKQTLTNVLDNLYSSHKLQKTGEGKKGCPFRYSSVNDVPVLGPIGGGMGTQIPVTGSAG